jgi:hypothetical protein
MCVFHCTLILPCHIHSTAWLYLNGNRLTGTIPSQVALMSNLCESSVVWLLVVMVVLSCVFHGTLILPCHIHSADTLYLSTNNLMGAIPSQLGLLMKLSAFSIVWMQLL